MYKATCIHLQHRTVLRLNLNSGTSWTYIALVNTYMHWQQSPQARESMRFPETNNSSQWCTPINCRMKRWTVVRSEVHPFDHSLNFTTTMARGLSRRFGGTTSGPVLRFTWFHVSEISIKHDDGMVWWGMPRSDLSSSFWLVDWRSGRQIGWQSRSWQSINMNTHVHV